VTGGAGRLSYGIACHHGCPHSSFVRDTITAGDANNVGTGLLLAGDTTGTRVEQSSISGGDSDTRNSNRYGLWVGGGLNDPLDRRTA
jgi:hypothetical protein